VQIRDELSLDELDKILSDTKELGGERIDITGGEPTLRDDYHYVIMHAKEMGYNVELVTNASRLTRTSIDDLFHEGLDQVAISLDGSSPAIYNSIRRKDVQMFHHVKDMISYAARSDLRTKVNTVAFSINLNDIPRISQWCVDEGVDEHGIYFFTPIGRGNQHADLVTDPKKYLSVMREQVMPFGKWIKLSVEAPFLEENHGLGCIVHEDPYHLQILPDGLVYPCAILASYNLPIGNLRKESIKDIWLDEKRWDVYWNSLQPIFQKTGSCVALEGHGLFPVCPLRKFGGLQ
jgi:MoaA/NifB/PqqE/SkfB family radical SAM enzyme